VKNSKKNCNIANTSGGLKYFTQNNINTNKNKQNINYIDPSFILSENINYKNFNNPVTDDNQNLTKVNVNISKNTNTIKNNIFDNKEGMSKNNIDADKDKDLNIKIKSLVEKIKENKIYEVNFILLLFVKDHFKTKIRKKNKADFLLNKSNLKIIKFSKKN